MMAVAALTAGPAIAGDFDGSKPLLFSVISVNECTSDGRCETVTPESIDLPQFLKIDFDQKTVTSAMENSDKPPTMIERFEPVDGKLMLQGAEDGYEGISDGVGWTIAISEDTGRGVLTASGDEVAFVVFGACIPY
jgi:hypothetical protein